MIVNAIKESLRDEILKNLCQTLRESLSCYNTILYFIQSLTAAYSHRDVSSSAELTTDIQSSTHTRRQLMWLNLTSTNTMSPLSDTMTDIAELKDSRQL